MVVQLPLRRDRFFCPNVLWRACARKDEAEPGKRRARPRLARRMVDEVASRLPGRRLAVLGDCASIGEPLLKGLPASVAAVGPTHRQAALTEPPPAGHRGRREKGGALTTPAGAPGGPPRPRQDVRPRHPKGEERLKAKAVGPCRWYASAGQAPPRVALVRGPEGEWRDEALLCGDPEMPARAVILGHMRRWGVEAACCESKQLPGLHDPMARGPEAVRRAHPTAWLVGGLAALWYAGHGEGEPAARRHRPWYGKAAQPAFADTLACLRLRPWRNWLGQPGGGRDEKMGGLLEFASTAA